MSEYEEQAQAFLDKTKTTLTVEFLRHAKYWPDEKDTRDVYRFTLTRGSRLYSSEFGQSINESVYDITMPLKLMYARRAVGIGKDRRRGSSAYNKEYDIVKVRAETNKGIPLDVVFRQKHNLFPTAYSILAGITKSDPGTLEEFCSAFGYSPDSIKSNTIYHAVKESWHGVEKLFTDEEISELQEIN